MERAHSVLETPTSLLLVIRIALMFPITLPLVTAIQLLVRLTFFSHFTLRNTVPFLHIDQYILKIFHDAFAECDAGYYTELADSTSCTACMQGTYKEAAGNNATACVSCSDDGSKTTPAAASTLETDCGKTKYSMISPAILHVCAAIHQYQLIVQSPF